MVNFGKEASSSGSLPRPVAGKCWIRFSCPRATSHCRRQCVGLLVNSGGEKWLNTKGYCETAVIMFLSELFWKQEVLVRPHLYQDNPVHELRICSTVMMHSLHAFIGQHTHIQMQTSPNCHTHKHTHTLTNAPVHPPPPPPHTGAHSHGH